jgi:hypothetical protein
MRVVKANGHKPRIALSDGEYLGLKLTVVGHECLDGIHRALILGDELLALRMQFGFGGGIKIVGAHWLRSLLATVNAFSEQKGNKLSMVELTL